jgi:hypothetical protein
MRTKQAGNKPLLFFPGPESGSITKNNAFYYLKEERTRKKEELDLHGKSQHYGYRITDKETYQSRILIPLKGKTGFLSQAFHRKRNPA